MNDTQNKPYVMTIGELKEAMAVLDKIMQNIPQNEALIELTQLGQELGQYD